MFIPRAHVRLEHVFYKSHSRSRSINAKPLQKIKLRDLLQLPCLVPTFVSAILGCVIIIGGAIMCVIGYNPAMFIDTALKENVTTSLDSPLSQHPAEYIALKSLSYVGPIFMGIGFFVMMVAVVLHCEIKDKFFGSITPVNNINELTKDQLYAMVLTEFRRNYFHGVEVPLQKKCLNDEIMAEKNTLFRALNISTPALLLTPDVQWNNNNKKPPNENYKRKLRRKFKSHDSWLKTSSLPDIGHRNQREKTNISVQNVQHRPNETKKMSKSCGPAIEIIEFPSSVKGNIGSSFDNPAFRDSPTERKQTEIRILNPCLSRDENIQNNWNTHCNIVIHKAAIHTESDLCTSQDNIYEKPDQFCEKISNGCMNTSHDALRVPGKDDCPSDIQNTFQRIIVKIKSCGNLKSEIFPSESSIYLAKDDCNETTPLNKVDHRIYTKPFNSESLLFVPGNKRRKSYGDSRSRNSLNLI